MKTLLVTLALVLASNVSAQVSLKSKYANTNSKASTVRLSKAEFDKLMASSVPVCIKDGAKVLDWNHSLAKSVGSDKAKSVCRSKNAQAILATKGLEVVTLTTSNLPLEVMTIN